MRFEIYESAVKGYYFTFVDESFKTIAISRSFPDRASLEYSISEVRNLSRISEIVLDLGQFPCFCIIKCDRGWIFHLKGFNNELIMESEGYAVKEDCILALTKIKEQAIDAKLLDLC